MLCAVPTRLADRAVVGVEAAATAAARRWPRARALPVPRRRGSAPRDSRRGTRTRAASAGSSVNAGESGAYGILSVSSRLADREPDRARELQLELLEIVLRRDEPLTLGLQLHLRPQDVDAGDDARGLEVLCLLESASAVSCCARANSTRLLAATASRYRFTATSTTRSRAFLMPYFSACALSVRGAVSFSAAMSMIGCDTRDARVEHVEGSDDGRIGRKAERLEIDHLATLAQVARDVRQQFGERAPMRAARDRGGFLLQKQAQIVLSARSTASFTESDIGPAVGGPSGTLPMNGLVVEICPPPCAGWTG